MDIYTVSFFGHREIENALEVERKLETKITELIQTKQYIEFLVGREGEFDILAASVVKRVKKQMNYNNCSITWVLPYMKAEFKNNEKEFLEYYDDVEICERSAKAHFKSAMQIRNRAMVDKSDFVICCIQHKTVERTRQYSMLKNIIKILSMWLKKTSSSRLRFGSCLFFYSALLCSIFQKFIYFIGYCVLNYLIEDMIII